MIRLEETRQGKGVIGFDRIRFDRIRSQKRRGKEWRRSEK
jgi:hypothetical protein